jgi:hypothetical protein
MMLVHKYAMNVIYYTLHRDALLDWDELIYNEVAHQLENFIKTIRFFMSSYLVFSLVFCNCFERLEVRVEINFNIA